MNWMEYFLEIAEVVKLKSKDQSTQIGAVVVGEGNNVLSTGYNSFPRGLDDSLQERQQRPEKYFWIEHAERNAIYNAARIGVSTKGCSLYLSHWFPCVECTRAIIQSGITTLYCDPLDEKASNSNYNESFKRSIQMLREAGVELRYYENIV